MDEVTFVSEKQVIEELSTKTLTQQGLGTKLIANFTRLMSRAFGKNKAMVTTPERKPSGVKDEVRSPGAPGEEFEGDFEGFVPEGKFISVSSHVRSYVQAFAERLNNLWKNSSDLVHRCFIPRKSPMIFRWPAKNPWNPREWISKRFNLRKKTDFWNDDKLLKKVREIAESHIHSRRQGTTPAKHLQGEITYLFDEKVRGEKESHILAWMVLLYMRSELENTSKWSLKPLHTEDKLSSIFNFIYHLGHDLGSVLVMKALAQRGHSPRLYKCEEGYLHYPTCTHTLWADVGHAMYGYMNKHLNLVADAPELGAELAKDVIEIAYNLYFMYAALNIDVASLLGVDQSTLTGWWVQVTMIQRDAYIQSASMLGGKGCATSRFEEVCAYISGLTQLHTTEAISVIRGKESHTGTCQVPFCHLCGTYVGQKGESESLSGAATSYWSHTDHCMKGNIILFRSQVTTIQTWITLSLLQLN